MGQYGSRAVGQYGSRAMRYRVPGVRYRIPGTENRKTRTSGMHDADPVYRFAGT